MTNAKNAIAPATGNLRGTLDAAGLILNGGSPLAAGWWSIGADCEFYLAVQRGSAVALGSVGAGSTSEEGGTYRRFRSDGTLYATMKAVSASGVYRANQDESA